MLSKHQQVQLLEVSFCLLIETKFAEVSPYQAATILSHLNPGTSLPEDRSHWPFFLSGGLLPPPSAENTLAMNPQVTTVSARSSSKTSSSPFSVVHHPVSSSVPVRSQPPRMDRNRSGSVTSTGSGVTGGPRMHDYSVPGGITQIRPGLLAHPTAASPPTRIVAGSTVSPYADEEVEEKEEGEALSARAAMEVVSPSKPQPMSVPVVVTTRSNAFEAYRDVGSVFSNSAFSVESGSVSASLAHSGGWSLPRSDLRSSSVARSYSGSRSGDEDDALHAALGVSDDDIDVDVDVADVHRGRYEGARFGFASREANKGAVVKKEADDGWDDMEMEVSHFRFSLSSLDMLSYTHRLVMNQTNSRRTNKFKCKYGDKYLLMFSFLVVHSPFICFCV